MTNREGFYSSRNIPQTCRREAKHEISLQAGRVRDHEFATSQSAGFLVNRLPTRLRLSLDGRTGAKPLREKRE